MPKAEPDSSQRVADLQAQINKAMGAGTILRGSDPSFVVEYLPTGVLPMDVLLQGGLPRGRMVEIYGDYSSLKSYIGLKAIAETQRNGGIAALQDTEHAFDPAWATNLGVDVDALIVGHPPNGEAAIDATEILIRSGVDLVVWDSVAATLPKSDEEKMAGDKHQPARLAALMSEGLRKLNTANSRTALLWINQTRMKVGIMFGNPEIATGGKALGFYSSMRILMKKAGKVTVPTKVWDGDKNVSTTEVIGTKIKATKEKSKLNAPNREVWFTWLYREGDIDEIGFLISQGIELGIVKQIPHGKQTQWMLARNRNVSKNLPEFRGWLEKNPRPLNRLREAVLAGGPPPDSSKE